MKIKRHLICKPSWLFDFIRHNMPQGRTVRLIESDPCGIYTSRGRTLYCKHCMYKIELPIGACHNEKGFMPARNLDFLKAEDINHLYNLVIIGSIWKMLYATILYKTHYLSIVLSPINTDRILKAVTNWNAIIKLEDIRLINRALRSLILDRAAPLENEKIRIFDIRKKLELLEKHISIDNYKEDITDVRRQNNN